MTDKQIIIDGECLRCGAKTKKHILVCEKCTEEMGAVIAHKFTIDKQTREIKQLKKQLLRKEQECEKAKQNAQDTYDLWQALIESFNILQGEKIKLEQECEELKKQWEFSVTHKMILEKDYKAELDQFKAENEALFKAIEEVNKINKRLEADNEELKEQLEIAKQNYSYEAEKLEIYIQTLTEIKEIITSAIEQNTLINLEKILQKINEVEDEKSNN